MVLAPIMNYLVTRCRRGWTPGEPHPGYDEFVDGKPTGIIIGNQVASDPADMTSREMLDAIHEGLLEVERTVNAEFKTRLLLRFDWSYGTETEEVASAEQAAIRRNEITAHFKTIAMTNWRLIQQTYREEERQFND